MILVTGASGYVGGAVLRRLSERGHAVSGMVRSLARATQVQTAGFTIRIANYDDRAKLERAFQGVDRLVFVASDGDARAVMRHHANVIEAAASAGVRHVVFTSITDIDEASNFYFTPVYRDAERRLLGSGVEWTIVRCGLYADLILANWLQPAFASGELSLPVGTARVAPISRDDVAEALATLVASNSSGSKIYTLTGPKAYSFEEIAEIASSVFDMPLHYVSCSPADYLQRAWAEMADPWPHAFSSLCKSISEGRYTGVSPDFEVVSGRTGESFEDFLRRMVATS
ncbi:NAD(P)H-binding protein [Sinorhizobium numidicum]|uniref:NAD(P)H-binding protein n=1 Tax=Sinorhizobium numidicum TaxID=680248 RepID=A0ABY8CZW7_9HYPH|nr:NAD(P)H-binding protein [Sinorhizobium numidicum]WEX76253.1 NAD(P)H-binding protein [Sinorhizobium numidicum]WEX82913.1 NAD(P)H-binding protein [Sinorhizobium numidicum]